MTRLSGFVETFIDAEEAIKIKTLIDAAIDLMPVIEKEISNKEHVNVTKVWIFTKKHFSKKSVKNKYPNLVSRWVYVSSWGDDVRVYTTDSLKYLTDIHYKLLIESTVLLSTDEAYALALARKQKYNV